MASTLMLVGMPHKLMGMPHKVAAARRCTLADARGTYGFQFSGFAPTDFADPQSAATVPFAETGTFVVRAQGAFEGSSNLSYGGQVFGQTFSGQVTVHPDCTAEVSGVNHTSGGPFSVYWVMVKPGETILLFSPARGTAVNGRAERMRLPRRE
jgi:hypothetical protein